MRVIAFPGRGETSLHEELDAALRGEGDRATSEGWRELREDVRALTPPMSADFERLLRARIAGAGPSSPESPQPPVDARSRRSRLRWTPVVRLRTVSALGALATVIAAIAVGVTSGTGGHSRAENAPIASEHFKSAVATPSPLPAETTEAGVAHSSSTASTASTASPVDTGSTAPADAARGQSSQPARVQQQAASITLSPSPSGVQSVADRVARLTVSNGGFVQSSQVQVRQGASSEASLSLKLPSARLAAALTSISELAPTRSENQSLQDITSAYDEAHRALADAVAERVALLRALARASTQGQIDSLREQLSLAGGRIAHARSAVQAVSAQANMSTVEVSVLGAAARASSRGTLQQGVHDVGAVLADVLVGLLIAAAVLVPLSCLLGLFLLGQRAWRRHARERALEQP